MPTCTFLFSRHHGAGTYPSKPTGFMAQSLAPLIDKARSDGSPLHIIHDMVPVIGLSRRDLESFRTLESNREFRREVSKTEREWRIKAKERLRKLDNGENSPDDPLTPERALILEINRQKSRSVVNHMGFITAEVVMELTGAKSHSFLAMDSASRGDLKGAMEHMRRSHDALSSAVLLRDTELVRQMDQLGHDAVVLRNLNHIYLSEMDRHDIWIIEDRRKSQLYDHFVSKSIKIDGTIDEVELTFSEAAVNRTCVGINDEGLQKRDALLDLIFIGLMNKSGMWKESGGFEKGMQEAKGLYSQILAQSNPAMVSQKVSA